MSKGKKGIILLFSVMAIIPLTSSSASLAFAQEETQETNFFTDNEFSIFWINLFESLGESIAVNTIGVVSAIIVIGIGYFVGKGFEFGLRKFLKKIFSNKRLQEAGGIKKGESYETAGWGQISDLIPMTAKWFVWIYAFVIAIDLFGFTEASQWLGVLWTYIPNIVAFIILIVVGIIGTRVVLQWMEKYNADMFGESGNMKVVKTLVTVIIYALIFGIGITQLGVGEEIVPILYWVILAGIMGILIAGSTGLREVFRSWSYAEGLKHDGLKVGDQITIAGIEGTILKFGMLHTTIKFNEKEKLIPNVKLKDDELTITKRKKDDKK